MVLYDIYVQHNFIADSYNIFLPFCSSSHLYNKNQNKLIVTVSKAITFVTRGGGGGYGTDINVPLNKPIYLNACSCLTVRFDKL